MVADRGNGLTPAQSVGRKLDGLHGSPRNEREGTSKVEAGAPPLALTPFPCYLTLLLSPEQAAGTRARWSFCSRTQRLRTFVLKATWSHTHCSEEEN